MYMLPSLLIFSRHRYTACPLMIIFRKLKSEASMCQRQTMLVSTP